MPSALANEAHVVRPMSAQDLVLMVYRQMRILAGRHADLDDLVQTAAEQVLVARFEGHSKYSTFVYAICYRVWMKHLRSSYRFFRRFEPWSSGVDLSDNRTPLSDLVRAERHRLLGRVLEHLTPKLRAVVVLHDIAGLDVEDIASIVDAKVTTVRSRLRDGRKRLALLLAKDPYFSGDDPLEGEE